MAQTEKSHGENHLEDFNTGIEERLILLGAARRAIAQTDTASKLKARFGGSAEVSPQRQELESQVNDLVSELKAIAGPRGIKLADLVESIKKKYGPKPGEQGKHNVYLLAAGGYMRVD